jgi:hypothetical protein
MGVPRTLAKGLSKLKEAAELRKLGGTQAERMARAAEQGYDTSRTLYHGTSNDITEFDVSRLGDNTGGQGSYGPGAYFSEMPWHAEMYAGGGWGKREGANVMPVHLGLKNPYIWDGTTGKLFGGNTVHPLTAKWWESGHDGALVYRDGLNGNPEIIEAVALDPSRIRSINADFNPEYRDSPNLLAGIAGAVPYAGATAALLAGATGSQEAEAGPLQTLGRAAPYLTSAALGGAAALQSGDAEAGKLDALGRAAPYLATGALGAAMMTPQDTQAYNDYIRDEMEARTAADKFTQMRGSKAGYWEARRQELLDMVNGLGEMANNVVLPALDKPLQGYLGLAGTLGTLASGGGFEQAIQAGARNATQPIDQTTYGYGGAVTDALSPYTTPEAAAAAGALVHGGIQIASPF